jgi:hypothetical protein
MSIFEAAFERENVSMEEMGLLSISPHCLPATSNTGQYMNHPR